MGTRVWMDGYFDRAITEKQAEKFEKWLKDSVEDYCRDEAFATRTGFTIGWIGWQEKEDILEAMFKHLPPGLSLTLECDYADCEEPGKERTWHGPAALELEFAYLEQEIDNLRFRQEQIKAKIAKREEA